MADLIGADVRAILTVIHDALAVPAPAAPEHAEAANRLVIVRAARVLGVVSAILDDPGLSSLEVHVRVARQVLAEGPSVTYPVREVDRPVPVDLADDEAADRAPAHSLPQIAAACPTCQAKPGELCTSHSGKRVRRNDTHQARRQVWDQTKDGAQ